MERAYSYKVATRCFTYNQAPYIENTLLGFVIQKTDFPIVFIVVDDASNDGEPDILQAWANSYLEKDTLQNRDMPYGKLIVGHLQERPLSKFVVLLLSENYYQSGNEIKKFDFIAEWLEDAEYHALCEGDDYWIDPLKIHKQVFFMDAHTDYGMCHTDFDLSDGSRRTHYNEKYPDGNYFPGIIEHEDVSIGTLTVLYRKEIYDKTPKFYFNRDFVAGDKAMWFELSREAKIKYLPEITACYRILTQSASHSSSLEKMLQFREGLQDIRHFYAEKYGIRILDYKNYCTYCLRVCYLVSSAEKADYYYSVARNSNSLTSKGLLFYLGAKYSFIKKLVSLWVKPK